MLKAKTEKKKGGYETAMERLEKILEWGGIKKDITCIVISAAALLVSLSGRLKLPFDICWVAVILCGLPIILEAVIGLVTEFDIKADVLVSIALIASVFIGEYFAAGEVAVIMQLGGLLEEMTVARARAGIEKLVHLTPRTARRVENGKETVIPADQVQVGDLLRVLPGETVPVDGIIRSGQTSINQAVMTGESLPVDKGEGDEVSSGTVNQFGAFDMEASRVGEDSSIQRMIRLVQSADAGKAKIVGLADRWATWIVVIALAAAVLTWLITGDIIRSVTILVVFCPCGLVLATPTAIMAAIGNAAKHGFLVREGDALERLAQVSKVTFDKTGTLTRGIPQVAAVCSVDPHISENVLYGLAAGAELRSEHPLGRAIVRCYKESTGKMPAQPQEFHMIPGRGVKAVVSGREILAGNREMMIEHGIAVGGDMMAEHGLASETGAVTGTDVADGIPADGQKTVSEQEWMNQGCTVINLAADGHAAGFIALSDTLRQEAGTMIGELKQTGVSPVLLTGDNENAARYIAGALSITEIRSGCLPQDKLEYIDELQRSGKQVCMIGDGINDAPALKKACVGIAMGGTGSDIAVDAADIALVDDEIRELPHLFRLSGKMMRTIKMNLTFSLTLNFIAIVLAITGILNPVAGALVHNAGSVFVIVNSALLLNWK
ncbi:MAG: cation-translocating P-type ATPase [Lachnospiraceae bacterium]|nr:cation-translocating P-type ATPase [Lachnospiraceae bacterium]